MLSHDSAIGNAAVLNVFENDRVRRFISRKARSARFRFPCDALEIGAKTIERVFQMVCRVDENCCLFDRHLFIEFLHKQRGSFGSPCLKQPYVEFVRLRIGGVQPGRSSYS